MMHKTAIDLQFSSDPSEDSIIAYNSEATSAQLKNVNETVASFSVRWDLKYAAKSSNSSLTED